MGLMDNVDLNDLATKGKDYVSQNEEQVSGFLDKAEEFIDEKTGGKFTSQVDMATDKIKESIGGQAD